jgi:hypothetical protein
MAKQYHVEYVADIDIRRFLDDWAAGGWELHTLAPYQWNTGEPDAGTGHVTFFMVVMILGRNP